MVGWHHGLNGHEFAQAPGDGEDGKPGVLQRVGHDLVTEQQHVKRCCDEGSLVKQSGKHWPKRSEDISIAGLHEALPMGALFMITPDGTQEWAHVCDHRTLFPELLAGLVCTEWSLEKSARDHTEVKEERTLPSEFQPHCIPVGGLSGWSLSSGSGGCGIDRSVATSTASSPISDPNSHIFCLSPSLPPRILTPPCIFRPPC